MLKLRTMSFVGTLSIATAFVSATAMATPITITVENIAPANGIFATPFWVGLHDGSFDQLDEGSPASNAIERVAEDGDLAPLRSAFAAAGRVDGVLGGNAGIGPSVGAPPVIDPGESVSLTLDLNPAVNRYLSYASMVVPSNDAFVANDDPFEHVVFDANGQFVGPFSFTILGSEVLDAGTELNNEIAAAFLDQMAPDTGVTTAELIALHPGFIGSVTNDPGAAGNILGGTNPFGAFFDPKGADFKLPGYEFLRVTVTPVPAAGPLLVAALGLGAFAARAARRTSVAT